MLKSQTGVLVGHIFANAAEEKIDFFEKRTGEIGEKYWARRFGERNRSADFERRTWKNVLALKCLCQSALCKNDSPLQGNRIFATR